MATFRNQVARDRAWARHYARRGLRVPVYTSPRSVPNTYRLANYILRAAKHQAAALVTSSLVKC